MFSEKTKRSAGAFVECFVKRLSRRKFWLGTFTVAAGTITDALAIEPNTLRISRIQLSPRPKHRLVHVTDIHYKGDAVFLREVVDKINEQQPDFVCFTGDLVEDSEHAPEALAILEQIQRPLFGIPGNHDYWADLDFDMARESFAKGGGRWLLDEQLILGGGAINLCGMTAARYSSYELRPSAMNILLSHYPNAVDSIRDTRFDLILAGHSHGGQVRLPGYGALIVPFGVGEYELGLYQTHAGPLYVGAGIGYFYANVRFFCRPEITVIEI